MPAMFESIPKDADSPPDNPGRQAPAGAAMMCAIAVLVVIAIWFAFYFFAFLPRGIVQ
jgi:hypothetical protein